MRRSVAVLVLAVLLKLVVPFGLEAAETRTVEGSWLGAVSVQGMKLRLAIHVARAADGSLTASLDSLDQGAKGLPVDSFTQNGSDVRFTSNRFGISYAGVLDANGAVIRGDMQQGGATLPLVFERVDVVPVLRRPQDPVEPLPYSTESVRYRNERDGVDLAGTLTLPRGSGPHAAVVLITGSGTQDRDESIAGHRPFLVIADHLTRRGMAVLRVDDRGVGGSSAGKPADTSETYAEDVLTGLRWLAARPEIDRKRIGLLGHSEGAVIAAIAAARSSDVAFIVMLAGMGQTGEEVILTQTSVMQRKFGMPDHVVDATTVALRKVFAALRKEPKADAAQARMRQVLDEHRDSLPEDVRQTFETVRQTLLPQLRMYTTAWFRYFIDYDPAADLRKVKVPVLALTGTLDVQAPATENLRRIEKSLRAGGNRRVTTRELPRLNHLLQTAETGLPNEYAAIEETIAPAALEAISSWIAELSNHRNADEVDLPH